MIYIECGAHLCVRPKHQQVTTRNGKVEQIRFDIFSKPINIPFSFQRACTLF